MAREHAKKIDYGDLDGTRPRIKVENGRDYSQTQKQMIREKNMEWNHGELRDDLTGKKGVIYNPASGEAIPPNALEIDHKLAQANGGPNSFSNARLINSPTNRAKSDIVDFPLNRIIDLIPEIPSYPKIGIRDFALENIESVLRWLQNRFHSESSYTSK